MAWETRHSRGRYFCLSVRRLGRVKREYYGKGQVAELAATLIAAQKVERRLARLQRQEEEARWGRMTACGMPTRTCPARLLALRRASDRRERRPEKKVEGEYRR